MSAMHLFCLTSDGGIPIFSRKRGDCESLSFATIASLNGVHMFCKSQKMTLKTTEMEGDGLIMWKEYDNCITFIGATISLSKKLLEDLLDFAYNAMICCVSLNEIKHIKNIEHLKRELKLNCYPIIDKLMYSAENELLSYTDCILVNDGQVMLEKLNEFSDIIGSPFCCLQIKNKIACATEGWWDLESIDRKLLNIFLEITNESRPDIPVFLPKKSPNIAYRLVSIKLCSNVLICVLCGAEPSYGTIENVAKQLWKNDLNLFENVEQCYTKNFPLKHQLDQGILGILLINKSYSKYAISRNLHPSTINKRSAAGSRRIDILRTFFNQAIDVMHEFTHTLKEKTVDEGETSNINKKQISFVESYWCSDYHKYHALNKNDNLIVVLYVATIPTHTMRLITQKILQIILSESDIIW